MREKVHRVRTLEPCVCSSTHVLVMGRRCCQVLNSGFTRKWHKYLESFNDEVWKKLHCFSNAICISKARIIQDLIINYTFCSPEALEKQKQYRKKSRERYDYYSLTPPTQEEIEAFYKSLHKKMEEREQRLDQIMEAVIEDYEGRLSESKQDDS